MEQLLKTWSTLSDDNQLLIKKGIAAGFALYILLLAIHDLLPYALVSCGVFFLYNKINKSENSS